MPEFIGGVRFTSPVSLWLGGNATWPFARLTLDEDHLELALRGPFARLPRLIFGVLPVEIAYEDLLAVEVVRPSGIRFHTQTKEERGRRWDRRNGVISWCGPSNGNRILDLLEVHGVPIGPPKRG